MTREEKIEALIQTEWELFQQVHNEGGRASCQDDPETFHIMRKSQFSPWPEELIDSYRADLARAEEAGRNLLTEKYAWMMASTAPEEFQAIRRFLQPPSFLGGQQIEEITTIQVEWMREYRSRYPQLASGNRVLETSQDTPFETSFETYLRGELHTYSGQTLSLYRDFVKRLEQEGKNLTLLIMEETVRAYGYRDLEDAEEKLKRRN